MNSRKGQKRLLILLSLFVIVSLFTGCRLKDAASLGQVNVMSHGPSSGTPLADVVAKFGLYGFAAVPTSTCPNGTTGGAGGEVNYVSTGDQLQAAIDKSLPKNGGKPQIIYVQGKITPSNTTNKQIDIKDTKNISIIGVGTSGELDGIGINIVRSHNIIIQNLKIHHNEQGQKDGICIQSGGSHIWIDHCELYNSLNVNKDYYDELLSAKNQTEYITISWCYLHDSWKTWLVGSSDSDNYDRKITFHHNMIENCNSRLPLFRFGTGHIYNNYYLNVLDTGINSRMGAKIRIENNYFEKVHNPIGSWYSNDIGYWYVSGNVFDNCTYNKIYDDDVGSTRPVTSSTYSSTCSQFSLPYNFDMESAEQAKYSVLMGAGVGKIGNGGGTGPGDPGDPGDPTDPPPDGPLGIALQETFNGANSSNFWTASYKSIPGDPSKPMYYPLATQSGMTFSNNRMTLDGARFAIGMTDPKSTSSSDTKVNGSFDLSSDWRITIKIASGSGSKNFQVQIDNNTTSGGSSMHGSRSRIFNETASTLGGKTITLTSEKHGQFTANSFIVLRTESNATVVIDEIIVETPGGSSGGGGSSGLLETFNGANSNNFWTTSYKAIPGTSLPMYYATSDQKSKITFSNNRMTLDGARFAIGQTDPKSTSSSDTKANGSFDLSGNWKITIKFISGSGSKNFQVQIDNNTTSGGSSMHSSKSRIYNVSANTVSGKTVTLTSDQHGQFTSSSFIYLRCESDATVVIDEIRVETW